MTKSTKNKRYRGGDGGDGIMSFFSNAWNATKKNSQGLIDSLTGNNNSNTSSSNYSSNSGSSTYSNTVPSTNTNPNPISSSTSVSSNRYTVGGRKRKIKRRYKKLSKRGGTHGAAHVNNMLVAKPTYWINGGKTKKRRRHKKH